MIKQSVKKPFTVLVAVIMIIALGVVSLTGMTADLLPDISLPYLIIISTYPGASPEKIEKEITIPIESAVGVVDGVKNITSSSSENYCTVQLEFEEDTDMDSALVKIFTALDPVEARLPEGAGTPEIMSVSMDMLATVYMGFEYDGMDIYELSEFAENEITPAISRVDGVANVNELGLIEKTVHVALNEEKVDALNIKILAKTNKKLGEAYEDILEAKQKLIDAQDDYDEQIQKAEEQMVDAKKQLEDSEEEIQKNKKKLKENKEKLDEQIEELEDQEWETEKNKDTVATTLSTTKTFMNALKADGVSTMGADMQPVLSAFAEINEDNNLNAEEKQAARNLIGDVKASLAASCFELYDGMRGVVGQSAKKYTVKNITSAGVSEIEKTWPGLWSAASSATNQGLTTLESTKKQLDNADEQFESAWDQIADAKEQLKEAEEQLADAEQKIKDGWDDYYEGLEKLEESKVDGQKQIDDGWESYYDGLEKFYKQRDTAIKQSNADQLLNTATLAQLVYAQNFEMPAGYIDDEEDNSWLLKVGQGYTTVEDLSGMVLTRISDIGDIHIGDVADITIIDNAGDSYARMNGEQALVYAVYKGSTAPTKEVGDAVIARAEKLCEQFDGLHMIKLMNQGDYISLITNSVLESLLIGAVLAIIILAIFLKDIRPTLVVAISMPLSLLFAIVCLYFSGITLNMMSLSGLALGIGMLVDNSIVVIENIYRLRTLGMPSAKAAVEGAKQVAAPIISSTLTTACVFLPMVFTTGLVKELLLPMGAAVVYCLVASLLVAMSVVPASGSTLLRNSKPKDHRFFDKLMDKYGKTLGWSLKHKAVPLFLAIALFAGSVYEVIRTGIIIIPEMFTTPLEVSVSFDDDVEKDHALEVMDEAIERVMAIDGVESVGAMSSSAMLSSVSSSTSGFNYHSFTMNVLMANEKPSKKEITDLCQAINTACEDLDCEVDASAGSMDMSMLVSSGVSIRIMGNRLEEIVAISEDVMDMMASVEGYTEIKNGMEDGDKVLHLIIDKNKAMSAGLSVAQIYSALAGRISDTVTATTVSIDSIDMDLEIQDATRPITKENLLDFKFDISEVDDDGMTVIKTYKLGQFATVEEGVTASVLRRYANSRYMTVTAQVEEGYNATLLSRELQPLLAEYETPAGYRIVLSGESETVNDMMLQMGKLAGLAALCIYLIMVAQFQSLLSPFIVLFTVPLAFTGGMVALLLRKEQLSIMALMGFIILMGTVVNNGIVFVDYVNQLRIEGMDRFDALIETGKTRMRPILMTALTTILAMGKLLFGADLATQMGGGMAAVIMGGLAYATLMTLYIIPVVYDILFKKPPLNVDVENA